MTKHAFRTLRDGDIVCSLGTGNAYVIVRGFDGTDAVGVRTVVITNPFEWELVELGPKPEPPPTAAI